MAAHGRIFDSGGRRRPARRKVVEGFPQILRKTLHGPLLLGISAVLGLATAGLPGSPARAAQSGAAQTAAARASSAQTAGSPALPAVWPTPQQMQAMPGSIAIPSSVAEVTSPDTDAQALAALDSVLRPDGVRRITRVTAGQAVPHAGLVLYVGTPSGNPAVAPALTSLHAPSPTGLPAGGYVLAAGHPAGTAAHGQAAIVLAGADGPGTFYAAQTLRQLIVHAPGRPGPAQLRDVVVKDWPAMGTRGVIEGFYGPAWSNADISSQLRFYGRSKLNTFVYSAKADPYLRADWQRLYPAGPLGGLRRLVTTARSQHVSFVYALSPGLSICYSSPTDLQELEAKDQQLWDAGVRQFALFFDDISTGFNCPGDTAMFGSSSDPLAAAQVYLLNAFVKGFIDTHPGAGTLITVPTYYSGSGAQAYVAVWKASLTPRVLVYWTGPSVISATITAAQASAVASAFGHQIMVWDNFPVNDYDPTRLFLGPLTGRASDLGTAVAGFTSNPMQEAAPSTVPLFTTAAYTWNPYAYNASPTAAWAAGISRYAGRAAAALNVFASGNQSVPRMGTPEATALTPLISAFWTAYTADTGPVIGPGLHAAAHRLLAAWQRIAAAPPRIDAALRGTGFVSQARPWLAKFRLEGLAGAAAVRLLLDEKTGSARAPGSAQIRAQRQALTALYRRATDLPVVVGQGVFNAFLLRAEPTLFTQAVRLYAATPADGASAVAAARAAGLGRSQVVRSFATAWSEASSGEYLVIAVGDAANNALYYNSCGWANPSGLGGGSTPFDIVAGPLDRLPAQNYYEDGAAATAAQTPQRAAGLAYYAVHGQLPAGVTALPAAAAPAATCSGTPSP